ncbi:MAG TPA: hypothetical protein VGO78_07705 [Acidimicrobiales bacterium]|nr:hypothetical protein [Acidimicrobiales bacterium]
MRLAGAGGDELELSIVGYQFPEADDPRQRFSWHVVEGRAVAGHERWSFRWPALTCDESPRLAAWLRVVAAGADADTDTNRADGDTGAPRPGTLTFTEPNLSFAVLAQGHGPVTLRVGLDLEFRPPSTTATGATTGTTATGVTSGAKGARGAGRPTLLHLDLRPDDLRRAAHDLDADIARYPDGLAAR